MKDLVVRAKKGDAEAQTALVRATQERLFRFCYHLCRDRGLAQDLAQDSLIRALAEIGKLKEPEKFLSWLYRIARNLFLDHVKSPANATKLEVDEKLEAQDDQEFSLHLRQVLQQLDPEDRFLLLLIDLEERTYQEAAEIVGISESNVKFRLHHIRKEFINKYEV
jgi:RNA polymerase sigma-70 factor, ECF subfamily